MEETTKNDAETAGTGLQANKEKVCILASGVARPGGETVPAWVRGRETSKRVFVNPVGVSLELCRHSWDAPAPSAASACVFGRTSQRMHHHAHSLLLPTAAAVAAASQEFVAWCVCICL